MYTYRISTNTLSVIAGERYELKVTLPDGTEATAETIVPHELLEIGADYTSYNRSERENG